MQAAVAADLLEGLFAGTSSRQTDSDSYDRCGPGRYAGRVPFPDAAVVPEQNTWTMHWQNKRRRLSAMLRLHAVIGTIYIYERRWFKKVFLCSYGETCHGRLDLTGCHDDFHPSASG